MPWKAALNVSKNLVLWSLNSLTKGTKRQNTEMVLPVTPLSPLLMQVHWKQSRLKIKTQKQLTQNKMGRGQWLSRSSTRCGTRYLFRVKAGHKFGTSKTRLSDATETTEHHLSLCLSLLPPLPLSLKLQTLSCLHRKELWTEAYPHLQGCQRKRCCVFVFPRKLAGSAGPAALSTELAFSKKGFLLIKKQCCRALAFL